MKTGFTIPPSLIKAARTIFARHGIISFLLAMMTLIYCVYSIQQVMGTPSDTEYRDQQLQKNTKTSFDRATIEQVKKLRTVDDVNPIKLPPGRINPF